MTKHADRIWRTVVFAGAMLGAPLVAAETPPKDAKPAPKPAPTDKDAKPKPPDTVASMTKELADLDKKISITIDAVTAAQNDADRQAAKAKLESHRKAKVELEKKLADLKRGPGKPPPSPATPLDKLEKELAANQAKLTTAVDAVVAAQNDADRQAAKAKLTSLQKEKAEIEKKITAEKQRLARPRTNESDKPIGRGFVLA